jgi:hyaluronoglucosaminidase
VPRTFGLRGIVEGFYGQPWSHAARLDVLSFVAQRDMNAYVYAPKEDAKHRAQWREPYDEAEFARFRELIDHARDAGISFGFAISPGLDIDYADAEDRALLRDKLRPFAAAGVSWFLLLLDDIPPAPGLAERQADVATWLRDALRNEHDDVALALCPTEYIGTRSTPYLSTLAAQLPADVDVMWTGLTVCSPVITAEQAAKWSAALGGRKPLVWDNYPVNDGTMEASLHLGPYRGRDAALADATVGVLCNPMRHAQASKIALATAADFLRDPDGYDAARSWRRAIDDVGHDRSAPLRALAEACADSPICEPDDLDITRRVDELQTEIGGPGWMETVRNAVELLRGAKRIRDDFDAARDDATPLDHEVVPWATAAAAEAEAGLAALRLLQQLRPVAAVSAHRGRAASVDPQAAMMATFMVIYSWSAARRNTHNVFGPRFVFRPQIVQLDTGDAALDVQSAIREDANAIDALCRLAVDEYDAWRAAPATTLRVFVDGTERSVADDGRFDAQGVMVLVRDDHHATRVGAGDLLPFRDPRLS